MNEFYFIKPERSIFNTHQWVVWNRANSRFEPVFCENRRLARFMIARLNAIDKGIAGEWILSNEITYS